MWLSRFESWPGSRPSSAAAVTSNSPEPGGPAVAAVVLAAGQGTRMRSRQPKVLHQLAHRPLICRALDLVRAAGVRRVVVVLGHQAEQVQAVLPAGVENLLQGPP